MKQKTIKLKLNAEFRDHKVGDIVEVEVDEQGLPLDRFWRNRMYDMADDKCVEVVSASQSSQKKQKDD